MLKLLVRRLCHRIYSIGLKEYQYFRQRQLFARCTIKVGTTVSAESEIVNLAQDPQKIIIGENCQIHGLLLVYSYGGYIEIGDYCSVSPNTRIISNTSIKIGNRVLIAHNVNILDNISHPLDAKLRHEDFKNSYTVGMKKMDIKGQAIVIEDDVWIGLNSVIMRGIKIGRGAIIGAGSVVTKDVEPWTVNVGNPLKCIRSLQPIEF